MNKKCVRRAGGGAGAEKLAGKEAAEPAAAPKPKDSSAAEPNGKLHEVSTIAAAVAAAVAAVALALASMRMANRAYQDTTSR